MERDITFTTTVSQGERIQVSTAKNVRTPPFLKLGANMGYNRSKFPAYDGDLVETMKNLSRGANWFFWTLLKKKHEKTNTAEFTPKNPTEAQRVTRAYKELHKVKLIKRVRRSKYIINPAVIQPRNEDYEEVYLSWLKN